MWLKNGQQNCPKCAGKGCYSCNRLGIIVLCPGCANQDMDHIVKVDGGTYLCGICQAAFTRSGVITKFETKDSPKKKKVEG